jgi:hypothetical protein
MFKIYTRHTQEVGETVIEHLWFTIRVGLFMITSGVLLLAHGATAGILRMPKALSLEGVRDRLNSITESRAVKKKSQARAAKTRKQLESLYALKQEEMK